MIDLHAASLLAFALTYLVHSTLFIAIAVCVTRSGRVRSLPLREAIWTVALFGGVCTALLQTHDGVRSAAATWTVAGPMADSGDPVPADLDAGVATGAPVSLPGRDVALPPQSDGSSAWMTMAAWLCVVASLLSLLPGVIGGLRRRRPVTDARLCRALDDVRERAGVAHRIRLSESERVRSPVAFGLIRKEICLPRRALAELDEEQQRAMLAHELGHLVRRDPLRLLLGRLMETVFFFQPLNRLARRRLFEVVELRCDAYAVALLGDGLSLADCLTRVAGWLSDRDQVPMAAMAQRGSPLAERVRRLVDAGPRMRDDGRGRRAAAVVVLAFPLAAVAAPGVDIVADPPDAEAPFVATPLSGQEPLEALIRSVAAEAASLRVEIEGMRALARSRGAPADVSRTLRELERRATAIEGRVEGLLALRARASADAPSQGDLLGRIHDGRNRHMESGAHAPGAFLKGRR